MLAAAEKEGEGEGRAEDGRQELLRSLMCQVPDLVIRRIVRVLREDSAERAPESDLPLDQSPPLLWAPPLHQKLPAPAVVFFLDVSGFTVLSERLNDADAVRRVLNTYFGPVLSLVLEHGGDVIKFAGDALLCVFHNSDGDDDSDQEKDEQRTATSTSPLVGARNPAVRALRAALEAARHEIEFDLADLFTDGRERSSFSAQARQRGNTGTSSSGAKEIITLRNRVVLAGGLTDGLEELHVGTPGRLECLLTGSPLVVVGDLMPITPTQRVGASAAVLAAVHAAGVDVVTDPFRQTTPRGNVVAGARLVRSLGADADPNPRQHDTPSPSARLRAELLTRISESQKPDLIAAVTRQLASYQPLENPASAEMRRVTTLFVNLATPQDGPQVASVMQIAASYAASAGRGIVRQVICDDKGAVVIVCFGGWQDGAAANTLHPERQLRRRGSFSTLASAKDSDVAVQLAIELRQRGVHCSMGMATGRTFCGIVGSNTRNELAVVGPSVNLAARLAGKAAATVRGRLFLPLLIEEETAKAAMQRGSTSSGAAQQKLEEVARLSLKGIAKAVPVFSPRTSLVAAVDSAETDLALGSFLHRTRHSEPNDAFAKRGTLLGREDVLNAANDCSFAIYVGEAGSGRTALLREAAKRRVSIERSSGPLRFVSLTSSDTRSSSVSYSGLCKLLDLLVPADNAEERSAAIMELLLVAEDFLAADMPMPREPISSPLSASDTPVNSDTESDVASSATGSNVGGFQILDTVGLLRDIGVPLAAPSSPIPMLSDSDDADNLSPVLAALSPTARAEILATLIAGIVRGLLASNRILIAIDDIDELDDASIGILSRLAKLFSSSGGLTILATVAGDSSEDRFAASLQSVFDAHDVQPALIPLRPLTGDHLAALLRSAWASARFETSGKSDERRDKMDDDIIVDERVLRLVRERTAGQPRLAVEFVSHLTQKSALTVADSGFGPALCLRDDFDIQGATSADRMLLGHFEILDRSSRDFLKVVSVIKGAFSPKMALGIAAQLSESGEAAGAEIASALLSIDTIEEALSDHVMRHQFVQVDTVRNTPSGHGKTRREDAMNLRLVWSHDMARTVVFSLLPPEAQRSLHAAAAAYFLTERLTHAQEIPASVLFFHYREARNIKEAIRFAEKAVDAEWKVSPLNSLYYARVAIELISEVGSGAAPAVLSPLRQHRLQLRHALLEWRAMTTAAGTGDVKAGEALMRRAVQALHLAEAMGYGEEDILGCSQSVLLTEADAEQEMLKAVRQFIEYISYMLSSMRGSLVQTSKFAEALPLFSDEQRAILQAVRNCFVKRAHKDKCAADGDHQVAMDDDELLKTTVDVLIDVLRHLQIRSYVNAVMRSSQLQIAREKGELAVLPYAARSRGFAIFLDPDSILIRFMTTLVGVAFGRSDASQSVGFTHTIFHSLLRRNDERNAFTEVADETLAALYTFEVARNAVFSTDSLALTEGTTITARGSLGLCIPRDLDLALLYARTNRKNMNSEGEGDCHIGAVMSAHARGYLSTAVSEAKAAETAYRMAGNYRSVEIALRWQILSALATGTSIRNPCRGLKLMRWQKYPMFLPLVKTLQRTRRGILASISSGIKYDDGNLDRLWIGAIENLLTDDNALELSVRRAPNDGGHQHFWYFVLLLDLLLEHCKPPPDITARFLSALRLIAKTFGTLIPESDRGFSASRYYVIQGFVELHSAMEGIAGAERRHRAISYFRHAQLCSNVPDREGASSTNLQLLDRENALVAARSYIRELKPVDCTLPEDPVLDETEDVPLAMDLQTATEDGGENDERMAQKTVYRPVAIVAALAEARVKRDPRLLSRVHQASKLVGMKFEEKYASALLRNALASGIAPGDVSRPSVESDPSLARTPTESAHRTGADSQENIRAIVQEAIATELRARPLRARDLTSNEIATDAGPAWPPSLLERSSSISLVVISPAHLIALALGAAVGAAAGSAAAATYIWYSFLRPR